MPVGAIVGGVGGSLGSAFIGAKASKSASKAQKKSADAAQATQERYYQETRADLAPYREGGNEAWYSLLDMYGLKNPNNPEGGKAFNEKSLEDFKRSPDYEVARREGIRAVDSSAAAKGNLLSGGQLKAVERYGSDLASQKFGSYLDRLAHMAGIGESASKSSGSAAMTTGSNVANSQMAAGEAQAAGIMGANSAWQTGLEGFAKNIAPAFAPTTSAYKPHPLYG